MRLRCWVAVVGIAGGSLLGGSLIGHSQFQSAHAADAPAQSITAPLTPTEAAQKFDERIAPLLAQYCLECHGPEKKKGRLDLSHKDAAFAERKDGPVIIPGNAAESPLWLAVQSDEMPEDKPPLTPEDKELLRQWIDSGAVWSADAQAPLKHRPVTAPAASGAGASEGSGAAGNYLRRLTVPEYIETVRSTVGVDITFDAHRVLPRDLRADGFSNTAYNLTVDLGHVEAYAKLAQLIVERMDVSAFAAEHAPCKDLAEPCMRQIIAGLGKQLLRGPLAEREVEAFLSVAQDVADAGGDFNEAAGFVIEAMLQSPRFIYRIEQHRGDGSLQPVGDHELASRMSYIIWGAPPDEELMRAADAGELSEADAVEAQARRMLKDPRAREHSARFLEEWLNLGRLNNLRPNSKRHPKWNPELAADVREETLAFFEHVVWKQNRPMYDLINAQVTVTTPRLAKHYGLKPQGKGEDVRVYDLSSVPARAGLFTQASVLTIGGDDASMVARGLFILHDVLWSKIDPPPPCVDTTPVSTKPGLTQRGVALERLANNNCGGCHSKFEPLAFGLEKFDGIGLYHEKDEHGNKLRDDGEILFPGIDEPVKYNSSAELMDLLAGSDRVRVGITRKLTQFAIGRPLVKTDAAAVEKIHESAQQGGGTYQSLITAIVTSDLVRMTATETAHE